jgi:hypothetical protein
MASSHRIGDNYRVEHAEFITLQLARFDLLRAVSDLRDVGTPGMLFSGIGADTRAAGTEPVSHLAFVFLIFGLHKDAASANHFLDARFAAAPWLRIALESWSAVLQPTRHKGEANYLNRDEPGPLFDILAPDLPPNAPFVAITTSGWNTGKGLDMNRVNKFSKGVFAVRTAMTAVDGLHSQQSFYFPRVLEFDQLTVTYWRNDEAASSYLYGPGVHRLQMDRQRDKKFADRTSFTRCTVVRSEGTWYGGDPMVWD